MSHTPGKLSQDTYGTVKTEKGETLRIHGVSLPCGYTPKDDASHHDTRRLVACWNACEGISTDNLKGNVPVKELAHRYNAALRERDELLAALKDVLSELEVAGSDGWMTGNVHQDEYNAARAAIAKAEGTTP